MKEFIDKLIERLEEKAKSDEQRAMKADETERISVITALQAMADRYRLAIEIVNQLAEEYKGGWIPCSERLPEHMQQCFTTARIYFVPDHVDEPNNYIGVELNAYSKDYGWLYNPEVIAWRPLPQPYKEGE